MFGIRLYLGHLIHTIIYIKPVSFKQPPKMVAKEEAMNSYSFENVMEGIPTARSVCPYIQGFIQNLIDEGYTLLSAKDYARSSYHLGRWMDLKNLSLERLDDRQIEKFRRHQCKCYNARSFGQRPSRRYMQRVKRFVEHIRELGVIPICAAPKMPSLPNPLVGYRNWMVHQCGLAERTIIKYEHLVSNILPALGQDPSLYDAAHIRKVLLDQVSGKGLAYAKSYIAALRSFLKYLSMEGQCSPGLNHAVPSIPQWRLSSLPRYLEPKLVERVISSCDLSKPYGVRDQAVLLLLARLGLRAGDIVSMRLEDFNWDAGTLKVSGKSHKEIALPLPQDVGDAVLRYLINARPRAESDRVFLCANAPIRPLARSATVSSIVMLALRRAGITDPPSRGAHLLRHSAATAMIRSGISYAAIATMLRHQSTDMTAYYAKVDVELLKQVAQPWPEDTLC